MRFLRLLSWPYVRKHVVRSLLTAAGIVLGIAVFTGMHTANQSVLMAFNRTVDQIAGKAQLQISAGEAGFDEIVLERVQALPQVRAAVPIIESTVQTGIAGQGNLYILGIDMTGDRSLRDYDLESGDEAVIDDPLVFLAQADSIMVSREFAQRNSLAGNSRIELQTMEGPKQFVVRGIMKSGGLAQAYGGSLAIMDIYAAQKVFGRGRMFDRIDLAAADGVAVEALQKQLQQLLGAAYTVDQPNQRGRQFENLTRIYAMTANLTSLFALFIGMFIIYNTFAIAVTQRRREIGILRALGAGQRQIRNVFLLESAIAGLLGSVVGIGIGVLIARALAVYLSTWLGELYGLAQKAEEVAFDPHLLGFALFMGVAVSTLAGWLPARQAASIDPIQALQKGKLQVLSAGENRWRRIAALLCLGGSLFTLRFSELRPVFFAGFLLSLFAALLLTPALSLWCARVLRPLLKWLRPVEGALAADALIQAPRRTSGTVAALMLSLSLVVALAGVTRASYTSIRRWLDTALNPDLYVTTSPSLTARSFRFPNSLGDELQKVEGVETVQRVRVLRISLRDGLFMLISAEIESLAQRSKAPVVEGDGDTMFQRVARGEGCLVSENFMHTQNVHSGDTLEIPSPDGPLRYRVLGVIEDYSDQQGSILIDRKEFLRHWRDDTVNFYRLYVAKGAAVSAVRQRILDRFGDRTRLFVLTNEQIRGYILNLTDQWFGITYVQIFVAVLVAILGIVNSLTVSIADRRRELGVLQAVGALRGQVRRTIWMEAGAIGLIGLALGLLLGAVNLVYTLEMSRRYMSGFSLDYQFPFGVAAILVPVILLTAFIAAVGPAEAAVRSSLTEALEYE